MVGTADCIYQVSKEVEQPVQNLLPSDWKHFFSMPFLVTCQELPKDGPVSCVGQESQDVDCLKLL